MSVKSILITITVAALCVAGTACSQRGKQPTRKKAAPGTMPAGTVKITSEPGGAAVFLRGHHRLGNTPLTLKRPDATGMRLMLVKDRYQRESFFVLVEGGKHKEVHRKLYPEQGKILVRAGPFRGGQIKIDGKFVGRVPSRPDVEAGVEHVVEVTMDNFHPYTERVTVKAGMVVTVNAIMIPTTQKAPKLAWLVLETDAPAMVYLDGTLIGSTPIAKIPVPAQKHVLKVASKALRREKTVSFTLKVGETRQLKVNLKGP